MLRSQSAISKRNLGSWNLQYQRHMDSALADVPQLNSNGDFIGEMVIDPGEGGTSR